MTGSLVEAAAEVGAAAAPEAAFMEAACMPEVSTAAVIGVACAPHTPSPADRVIP
jgi:hypothetical protein